MSNLYLQDVQLSLDYVKKEAELSECLKILLCKPLSDRVKTCLREVESHPIGDTYAIDNLELLECVLQAGLHPNDGKGDGLIF